MPIRTRLQTASSSNVNGDAEDADPSHVEKYLRNALQGVARLRSQVGILTRENDQLKADLDRLYEAQDVSIQPKRGKAGNVSVLSLTAQVNKLKRDVADLEHGRKKDKKKLRKLRLNEIKKDALELRGQTENGIRDESEQMKRLLRRFFELVSSPSMEEKEECAVCLTEMTLQTARSLPCGHIFCVDCLPRIEPRNCPNCRESFESVEDAEAVAFSATEQWDALLETAAEWGRTDKLETPEDTDEDTGLPFIEDDEERGSVMFEHSLADSDHAGDAVSIDDGVPPSSPSARVRRAALSTPPPDGDASRPPHHSTEDVTTTPIRSPSTPTPYQSSPISVKRQRMKELAEARKSKRSRP